MIRISQTQAGDEKLAFIAENYLQSSKRNNKSPLAIVIKTALDYHKPGAK